MKQKQKLSFEGWAERKNYSMADGNAEAPGQIDEYTIPILLLCGGTGTHVWEKMYNHKTCM